MRITLHSFKSKKNLRFPPDRPEHPKPVAIVFTYGFIVGFIICALFVGLRSCCGGLVKTVPDPKHPSLSDKPLPPVRVAAETSLGAVRPAPEKFPRNTYLPNIREAEASGNIDSVKFSVGRDLVYIDDARVWWDSDNKEKPDECDHSMHIAMVEPFTRLVNLVSEAGWVLKVQDCFRIGGVHASRSLHQQGRAIDITVGHASNPSARLVGGEMRAAYEQLSKLAWQAGFDWVYYEYGTGTGPHVHASVRAER